MEHKLVVLNCLRLTGCN